MAGVEKLVAAYERFVRLPWDPGVAGVQRVWFAVYAPAEERRLRARIGHFANATIAAGHTWKHIDITAELARWLAAQEYRDAYFAAPAKLGPARKLFQRHLTGIVEAALIADGVDASTVVAVVGVASLFGFTRVSSLVDDVAPSVRGRLLVLFPGERDGANYRLLDARDGFNYHAIPITGEEG